MKTITQTINLYTFGELSDDAKETAKQNLLNDPWYFWTDLEAWATWWIYPHFEETPYNVKWQGAFDFRQGDGCNIYGDFSYNELRRCAGYKPVASDVTIHLEPNRRYTYSLWDIRRYGREIYRQLADELGDAFAERQWPHIIPKICAILDGICAELREYGEDLIFNGYLDPALYEGQLFTENGERYEAEA